MARADVISAGVAAVQAADAQAIGEQIGIGFDAGVASVPVSAGGFSQSDIDAAVAAAKAVDASAAESAKAASDAALADLQSKLDALAAKEGQEAGVISGLQGSLAGIQASVAALVALIPAPAPAPAAPSA